MFARQSWFLVSAALLCVPVIATADLEPQPLDVELPASGPKTSPIGIYSPHTEIGGSLGMWPSPSAKWQKPLAVPLSQLPAAGVDLDDDPTLTTLTRASSEDGPGLVCDARVMMAVGEKSAQAFVDQVQKELAKQACDRLAHLVPILGQEAVDRLCAKATQHAKQIRSAVLAGLTRGQGRDSSECNHPPVHVVDDPVHEATPAVGTTGELRVGVSISRKWLLGDKLAFASASAQMFVHHRVSSDDKNCDFDPPDRFQHVIANANIRKFSDSNNETHQMNTPLTPVVCVFKQFIHAEGATHVGVVGILRGSGDLQALSGISAGNAVAGCPGNH